MKTILSPQNTYIKSLVQLKEKSRERKKSGLFLIEGQREISLAIKGGYTIQTILFFPNLFSQDQLNDLTSQASLNA
jgi:TrmH family RNA methyltransferase